VKFKSLSNLFRISRCFQRASNDICDCGKHSTTFVYNLEIYYIFNGYN